MRKFKADAASMPRWLRMLVVGIANSGKTHFAASAPKPLIIANGVEGGYKTVLAMDRALWWDPRHVPEIWELGSIFADIPGVLSDLEKMAAGGKFPYQTVVFDPVSLYVDGLVGELERRHKAANQSGEADGRQVWGDVATHLQMLIGRLHALPCHIIWCSHVKSNDEDGTMAIGGQMADKFPAYCDFKLYANVVTSPGGPTKFELRTKPYKKYKFLGCRYGSLPDPLIPSFKCVAELLGLPERPASPALPGYPNGVRWGQPPPNGAPARP